MTPPTVGVEAPEVVEPRRLPAERTQERLVPRYRQTVGPLLVLVLAAATAIGVTPGAPSPAGAASPSAAVPPKPLSAGTVQIDAADLAEGDDPVAITVDLLTGYTDATLEVTGTGEADATDTGAELARESSTAEVAVELAPADEPADPAEAALADASGSTVTATLTANDPDGSRRTASDTVWVDDTGDQVLVSESGEQDLRLQRVAALERDGTVSPTEADALQAEIRGGGARTTESVTPGSCVVVCVDGAVRWTDSGGGTHPVDRAPVQIWDEEGATDVLVTTVTTDADGEYTATIDNNDGDATGRDIYVRVLADGPGFTLPQHLDSAVDTDVPNGSQVIHNLTANRVADNNTAFAVRASLVFAGDHLVDLHGSLFPTVGVVFPDPSGSFFDGNRLHLLALDRFDWDVSLHEYGHYIADRIDIEANPGGPHSGEDNLSDARGSKSIGVRLAFGEGWPTYFAVSALRQEARGLGIPHVGDVFYDDTEDQVVQDNLEFQARRGEDNERTVSNSLWDLYDDMNEGLDRTTLGAQTVWNQLDNSNPTTLSAAYQVLSANRTNEGANCIFTLMNVSPRLGGPSSVNIRANSGPPRLTWTRGNGGSHRNNSFTVRFARNSGTVLFTSPVLRGQSYTPPATRWAMVRNQSGGTIRVTVVGTQTDNPRTGPYRSCTKAFVIGG